MSGLAQRLRFAIAGVVGMLGFALLWAGFGVSNVLTLQREALADSVSHNAPPSLISKERAALLQSTVDSTALSLSSVLASAPPSLSADREALSSVASVLSILTFGLGSEVYFTAWENTRMLHSPLAPDAEGMDFADAIDGRGAAFVLNMAHTAFSGGGFLQVRLPRQFSSAARTSATSTNPAAASDDFTAFQKLDILVETIALSSRREICKPDVFSAKTLDVTSDSAETFIRAPDHCLTKSPRSGKNIPSQRMLDTTPIDQIVYVRQIPRSGWHIAAFMPVDPLPGQGFSPAWSVSTDKNTDKYEADYRKGLCVSGFSLAGLAGLMLIPGQRGDRRES
jgi:hypothetical protein